MYTYPLGSYFNSLDEIKNKKITVMGLGLNGGGETCARFFLKHGAFVTVTDMKSEDQLLSSVKSLKNDPDIDQSRLRFVLGKHEELDFSGSDCVIKNPGVKIEGNKYLSLAKAIETDISIFLKFTKAPIIAVTGSKGKSSTVSSLAFGLNEAGFKCFLGGNITVSPLTFLEKTDGTTPVVLELSSWQLADLRGRKLLKPKIAIITRIVPDHQNWYGGMDSYIEDKKLIYENQDENDFLIVGSDEDGYLKECFSPEPGFKCWGDVFARESKARVFRYSKDILPEGLFGAYQKKTEEGFLGFARLPHDLMSAIAKKENQSEENIMQNLLVPGLHTRENVLNACLALRLMGVAPSQIAGVMGQWKGIPHRLERCHEWKSPVDGRRVIFYNDSCSTVPEATAAAVLSFEERIVLIAGGTDKDLDFLPLAKCLDPTESTNPPPYEIYLLSGSGTEQLTQLLDKRGVKYEGPFDSLSILLDVLKTCLISTNAVSTYGKVSVQDFLPVVFSPGATSFGMFSNEFERGEMFKDLTRAVFSVQDDLHTLDKDPLFYE